VSVIALIPAHDEAARIADTVQATRSVDTIDRVVVIDDASTDGTGDVAREAGAEVLALDVNRGKGGALQAGLDAVADTADVIVLLDGDLGATAAQAGLLLQPVLDGSADMTIATLPRPAGVRRLRTREGVGAYRHQGALRLRGHSPALGTARFIAGAWQTATPFARGYGVEVALTVKAAKAGLRIMEVPTSMGHAATGRDVAGFMHRGRQFVHVAAALVRLAMRRDL